MIKKQRGKNKWRLGNIQTAVGPKRHLKPDNYTYISLIMKQELQEPSITDWCFYSPWYGLNNEDSLSTNWLFHIHSSFYDQENTTQFILKF